MKLLDNFSNTMDAVSLLLLFNSTKSHLTQFSWHEIALFALGYVIYNNYQAFCYWIKYYEQKLSPYSERCISFKFQICLPLSLIHSKELLKIDDPARSVLWLFNKDKNVQKSLINTESYTNSSWMISEDVNNPKEFSNVMVLPDDEQLYCLENGLCIRFQCKISSYTSGDNRGEHQETKTYTIFISSRTKTNDEIQHTLQDTLAEYNQWISQMMYRQFVYNFRRECLQRNFLTVARYALNTTKTFNNMFFEHKQLLIDRLNFYEKEEHIYKSLGIQHSLGILLYGEPGCGKTSVIKSIANYLDRSILCINLKFFKDISELSNVFFWELLAGTHKLSHNKRIYVFEEIDCITENQQQNPFLCREHLAKNAKNFEANKVVKEGEGCSITTSEMLELLDGINECSDRIIIFTTNYPELLDKAFLRPGRIDLSLNFKKLRRVDIDDYFNLWFGYRINKDDLNKIADHTISQAEFGKLCFQYKNNPKNLIKYLVKQSKSN